MQQVPFHITDWTGPNSHTILQNGPDKLGVTWGAKLLMFGIHILLKAKPLIVLKGIIASVPILVNHNNLVTNDNHLLYQLN